MVGCGVQVSTFLSDCMQKWTFAEDRDLKSGIIRYGLGNWAKILQEFDFEGRTNVMLKDRWRTLEKQMKVGR